MAHSVLFLYKRKMCKTTFMWGFVCVFIVVFFFLSIREKQNGIFCVFFFFNKKPYHFYSNILKMLFHEKCFNGFLFGQS